MLLLCPLSAQGLSCIWSIGWIGLIALHIYQRVPSLSDVGLSHLSEVSPLSFVFVLEEPGRSPYQIALSPLSSTHFTGLRTTCAKHTQTTALTFRMIEVRWWYKGMCRRLVLAHPLTVVFSFDTYMPQQKKKIKNMSGRVQKKNSHLMENIANNDHSQTQSRVPQMRWMSFDWAMISPVAHPFLSNVEKKKCNSVSGILCA